MNRFLKNKPAPTTWPVEEMLDMTTTPVTATKVNNFKVRTAEGIEHHSGWCLANAQGGLYSVDGIRPHFFRSKAVASGVAELDGTPRFVKAQ